MILMSLSLTLEFSGTGVLYVDNIIILLYTETLLMQLKEERQMVHGGGLLV